MRECLTIAFMVLGEQIVAIANFFESSGAEMQLQSSHLNAVVERVERT